MPSPYRTVSRHACLVMTLAFTSGCGLSATLGANVPLPQTQVVVSAPPPPPPVQVQVAAPAPPPPPPAPPPQVVVVGAPQPMAVGVYGPTGSISVTMSPGIVIVWHLLGAFDMVGKGDSAVHPDGEPDGTLAASLDGPIDGLILVTTDPSGAPCCHQQWDTIVGQDPLPHIGSGFDGAGESTWVLGVMEKDSMRNDPTGRIALGPGKHAVLLTASSSGFFHPGQSFRLLVHHPGAPEWGSSPVFGW
jgi:hypothetical protein